MSKTSEIRNSLDIMIVGVGGQGVITASKILQEYFLEIGISDCVAAESRGVSQREGSVFSIIRLNLSKNEATNPPKSICPIPMIQKVDIMIAIEPMELLRNIPYLHPTGVLILNIHSLIPKNAIKLHSYPDITVAMEQLQKIYPNLQIIQADYTQSAISSFKHPIFANLIMLKELPRINSQLRSIFTPTFFSLIDSFLPPQA